MTELFENAIRKEAEYRQLLGSYQRTLKGKPMPLLVSGLCEGASLAFLSAVIKDIQPLHKGPAVLLCGNEKECVKLKNNLAFCGLRTAFYMARDLTFYDVVASHDYEQERLKVLSGLLSGAYDVLITTPDASLGYSMPKAILENRLFAIDQNDEVDLIKLTDKLVSSGYVKTHLAENPGQFAVRGDIIDIYPPYGNYVTRNEGEKNGSFPLRIELFDTEIDRMGIFDPESQRIVENLVSVSFAPARELLADSEALQNIAKAITKQKEKAEPSALRELDKELFAVNAGLESGFDIKFLDKYISLVYPQKECLWDYIGEEEPIFYLDSNAIEERITFAKEQQNAILKDLLLTGTISQKVAEYSRAYSYLNTVENTHTTFRVDSLARNLVGKALAGLFHFQTRHSISYDENEGLLLQDLHNFTQNNYAVILNTESLTEYQTFEQDLLDLGFLLAKEGEENFNGKIRLIREETPIVGFEMMDSLTVFLSVHPSEKAMQDAIIKKSEIKKHRRQGTQAILNYTDLSVGDYVVHEAYGIGLFTGIETKTCAGVTRDYVAIQYAGTDKLFVPVEKLDLVSKYIGAKGEDNTVHLSKIGSDSWKKSKAKAKTATQNIAKDLIRLYAERMRKPGFVFPKDDKYQEQFEEAFPFEETESQIVAANEIKEDMMMSAPMDRLLCGDVGYGKTEVALRAAYKAVLAGKQVAILVPTTLLALQHYQTIVSRMRSFAVSVDMLSRFRTATQQKHTLKKLERGEVDILVGTHRILSKDIKFHDLGLVVIDEEQRFGVLQKEKLKQMSEGVDVLSLSATPIPRTLSMAMSGIRDISVLDEAPHDRLPVQTYVLEENENILAEAIRKELRRGGQVFYLHNDTEAIYSTAAHFKELIPEANITVAHGQMDKEVLEDIWQEMLEGKIDVLFCTTIVETGVDIPNANTLIVKNANRLGLSQLHQFRGRIGRSSRRAYAYFTYPPFKALTEIAQKRLEAIREYAEFGAGFRIAIRDMEIRGAGNLLGAEQHGHLDTVGYDLYIKMLNAAVLEEKGEKVEEKVDCNLSLDLSAFISEKYVTEATERMALYRRIALISNDAEKEDMEDELMDRYGTIPKETENLLTVALIHTEACMAKVKSIYVNSGKINLFMAHFDLDLWMAMAKKFPNRVTLSKSEEERIFFTIRPKESVTDLLHKLFGEIFAYYKNKV